MPRAYFAITIVLLAISLGLRLMQPDDHPATDQFRNYYIFLDVSSALIAFVAGFILSAINW